MAKVLSAYQGCLLGLAVGDALGYTVDQRSLAEIREDYGPNGLMGYDLVNGYADVTSYTQLAAFTCNGLLLGLTQGQLRGRMSPFISYIRLGQREWAASQTPWGRPEKTFCWLIRKKEICRRHCMNTWMTEQLLRNKMGTPEEKINRFSTPGAITSAVGVGLFFDPETMDQAEIDRLGAEAVALTHGSPLAFLPGAVIAHLISRLLHSEKQPLRELVEEAMESFHNQFYMQFGQADEVWALVKQAISLAESPDVEPAEAMERLRCESGAQVLAGAVYAALVGQKDFDTAMIIAVNHSGRSAAVGAIAGAMLGAWLGEEALPEFYLECLEPADILRSLAFDLYQGCPMEKDDIFYDTEWDRKYLHGGKG